MTKVLSLLLLIPALATGQKVSVIRTEQLTRKEAGELIIAAVSPDGAKILTSTPGYDGLAILNLSDRSATPVTDDPGAGYEPVFTDDGKEIFYRTNDFTEGTKLSSLFRYDIEKGRTAAVELRARDMLPPVISQNSIYWSAGGVEKSRTIDTAAAKSGFKPFLTLENLTPVLHLADGSRTITPNGPGYYIWASLSPDKSKILYNFRGTATYICDLEGNILVNAGRINAPKWLSNEYITGMDDKDDGYRVISSEIICMSVKTGEKTVLTHTKTTHEMYPFPLPDGKRIVCQTTDGELFMLHLQIK